MLSGNNLCGVMKVFTTRAMPASAFRKTDIDKVKSTYDHLCGLLVHGGWQKEGIEGKCFSYSKGGKKKTSGRVIKFIERPKQKDTEQL